jgi:NitT/TauT family transport system substrate-binding protein
MTGWKNCAILAISASLLASGGAARADSEATHITIAQTSIALGFSVDFIAADEGFFKKEGMDVDIQVVGAGDPQTIAALRAGSAQFGAMTAVPAIQAAARGEKLLWVAPFVRQYVIQFVINPESAKKAGITADMPLKDKYLHAKGMNIATLDVGGGLDLMFHVLAKQYGMDADRDFTITAIHSYPALIEACKRGQIDIALTAIPFGTIGVQQEGLVMFADFWKGAIPELNGAHHQGIFVTADYAEKNPDIVRRIHDSIDGALVFLHEHPDKVVADLQKRYPNIKAEILKGFIVGDNGSYAKNGTVERHGFDLVRDFVAKGLIPAASDVKYDQMVLPIAREK